MLVSFEFSNFRSAKNSCYIDFRKTNISQHKDSLIGGRFLPVTVFYGPNGGGKSTIILAIDYLVNLINAPIQQFNGQIFPKKSYKPFLLDDESKNKPTSFDVVFCLKNNLTTQYKYHIQVKNNHILEETLYEKNGPEPSTCLFERNNNKVQLGKNIKDIVLSSAINDTMPFISVCAIMYPKSKLGKIGNWFSDILVVDYGNPTVELLMAPFILNMMSDEKTKIYVEPLLSGMKLIDGYDVVNINNNGGKVLKTHHNVKDSTYDLLFDDESMGTKKIIQLAPSITLALTLGNTLVIDELDAKVHPKLLEYIISLFTNKKVNKNGAQLIFTSHDMYTLNSKVFRRDEIYFACKNDEESTIVYSLSDIKGDDNRMSRVDSSYSKKYLEGKYGSDPYFNLMTNWEEVFNVSKK